jgi:hypothetical protein
METLRFLIGEHGNAHGFEELPEHKQHELAFHPRWMNLILLQEADARSNYLTEGGGMHGRVVGDAILEYRKSIIQQDQFRPD